AVGRLLRLDVDVDGGPPARQVERVVDDRVALLGAALDPPARDEVVTVVGHRRVSLAAGRAGQALRAGSGAPAVARLSPRGGRAARGTQPSHFQEKGDKLYRRAPPPPPPRPPPPPPRPRGWAPGRA